MKSMYKSYNNNFKYFFFDSSSSRPGGQCSQHFRQQHFPSNRKFIHLLINKKKKGKRERNHTTTYLGAITLRFHFLYHWSGGALERLIISRGG